MDPQQVTGQESLIPDQLVREVVAMGEVDIVVGIPTFNNASTVGQVVRAVQAGFAKYFPRERTALVTTDGGSTDSTLEQIRAASIQDYRPLMASYPLRTIRQIVVPYHGIPGKASALRTLFAASDLARAKACAIVDPRRRSVTPEWIESLVRPILKDGFDHVAPLYRRHKFDGLLIRNLIYPLVRSLYGANIREPLAGDYGLSGKLTRLYLEQNPWSDPLLRDGIELWMTTTAMKDGYRICESVLGAKLESHRKKPIGLGSIMKQVIGALFQCLERHEEYWLTERPETSVPVYGFEYDVALEPVRVSRKHMLELFRAAMTNLEPVLTPILSPETLSGIKTLTETDDRRFRYSDRLWVSTVFEFAAAYHNSVIHRDHVLQALAPLYLGRAASFVLENQDRKPARVAERQEQLCQEFRRQKGAFQNLWSKGVATNA